MRTTPKYKAKAVFWDKEKQTVVNNIIIEQYRYGNRLLLPDSITRFDSQHEFKVYLELVRMYDRDRIVRQYPIKIFDISYCYPRGKTWKVDFAIKHENPNSYPPHIYVEAKGAFLPEFASTLAVLENKDPDRFDSLFIVFGHTLPKDSKIVKNLIKSPIGHQLLTLSQLKNLCTLPLPL